VGDETRREFFLLVDQGSQFTAEAFTSVLLDAGVKISMDGVGRAIDNVFIERLWRTIKYDHIYLNPAENWTTCRSTIRYASTSELPEPVTTCSPLKKSVRLSKGWGPLDSSGVASGNLRHDPY